MTLNLNLSSNSIRSETQMKSQAHDVTDSSLDEFTGFHPTDIASSDTEMTNNSITISDDDDDDSTSHTTATTEFLDADDNLSNFSNAVPPSVAESDDITVTFSDADGMSEEISIQMVGNAVPPCPDGMPEEISIQMVGNSVLPYPDGMSEEISIQMVGNAVPLCHDDSTDDFSDDEIEKKLLLIRHIPNQIKEIRGSFCGGKRVEKYPTCFKKKKHSMAEIHQKSVEDNYYEEEAENIESNSDNNDHVEPDENEAENIENHSIHGDDQVEFPQGQPDENEAENIENHSIHGDDQAELPQQQPDIKKQDDCHNGSDDNRHLDLELQPNNSGHNHDDYKEMENKNDFPETPIANIDPENELLNAKHNITSKKETKDRKRKSSRLAAKRKTAEKKKKEDRKRKSSRLAAKSKATENKEKEDRKRKSKTSPAKSNKKLKQEEMSDDGDILYKLPKQILQENQKSKVMSETDQLQPIIASHLQKESGSFKQGWQPMGMYCHATKHLLTNDR